MNSPNTSTINLFLAALRRQGFRIIVSSRLKDLSLVPPYDVLVSRLMDFEGDIELKDFISVCYTFLHRNDVEVLENLKDVSSELGLKSFEVLLGLTSLDKIGNILKREGDIDKKINSIYNICESSRYKSTTPQAKHILDLETKEDTSIFKFLKYPFSRGKLYLIAAYSGVGKTNLSLSLAKLTGNQGLNTHYISIADWTEPEIRNKLIGAGEIKTKDAMIIPGSFTEKIPYPDIWLSILDEATVYDVELELEVTKPDVCIVDSITDLSSYASNQEEYFWETEKKARALRQLAVKYDLAMIITHQLIVRDTKVIPEDLLGSKAHLLKVVDLALGIGCSDEDNNHRVSTLKVRHHRCIEDFKINLDFESLIVYYV